MNGIEMMFKSMGFDPKKMIEDIDLWKQQIQETLKAINSSYLVVLKGQQQHTEQLNRIELHLQQNAIQYQKVIGMLESNHFIVCKEFETLENRMGEIWTEMKQLKDPLSAAPLVHPLPSQPLQVQTEQPQQQ